jgi:hypothetical protein
MNTTTALKLGQIAGALILSAGVAACVQKQIEYTPGLIMIGGLLYAGCRIAAWLKQK